MGDTRAGEVYAGPTELTGTDLKDCVSNHSLSSNASLPSVQSCRRLRERRAASWAVSFERLLQDPLGVRYFSVSRGAVAGPRGPRPQGQRLPYRRGLLLPTCSAHSRPRG